MTVKEVEQLTGMTRANIRYYEMEGLLNPERNANGHREYSKNDVEELNKIKLLRTLYISIEEIKELKANQKNLSEVLEVQLEKLERERKSIVQAIDVCRMMKDDHVDFGTLNARYYYAEYNRMTQNENEVLKADQIPQERIPVRRLLARGFDVGIYTIIWHVILMVLLDVSLQRLGPVGELIDIIIVWLLMIIFEGILLSRFGTTLGKWIFGIEVTNLDDGRLTFTEACVRCVNVFIYGYGCEIPVYGWWKQWKCFEDCSGGVPLKWEEDSCLVVKDKKNWRIAIYALAVTAIIGIEILLNFKMALPPNLGELTVETFSENFNELADEQDLFSAVHLNEKGEWEEKYEEDNSAYVIDLREELGIGYVQFGYIEEAGILKGITISGDISPSLYSEEIQLAMQAFIYAKELKSVMTRDVQRVYDGIMEMYDIEGKTFEVYGVEVTNTNKRESFELVMKIVE